MINSGGWLFPCDRDLDDSGCSFETQRLDRGVTMRELYAATALVMIQHGLKRDYYPEAEDPADKRMEFFDPYTRETIPVDEIARLAFRMADAMVAESAKEKTPNPVPVPGEDQVG